MRKIIFSVLTSAAIAVAVCAGLNQSDSGFGFAEVTDVEATAACEVSSDGTKNVGYYTPALGSGEDVCVSNGAPECVRCSGNL